METLGLNEIDQDYFDWLVGKVDGRDSYEFLSILFMEEFTWSIFMDENRAADGKNLRGKFAGEIEIPSDWVLEGKPANVFEVVLGIAIRMEDSRYIPFEDHIADHFWEIVGNAGWNKASLDRVSGLVKDWMSRSYDKFGTPGLFPLNDRKCVDQSKTEIWYQMHAYLMEKRQF